MRRKRPIILIILLLDVVFWGLLAINIGVRAVPFIDRKPEFEEQLPLFKFGRWAVPVAMTEKSPLFRMVYSVHLPSYRLSIGLMERMNPEKTWGTRLGALSIGAYVLISTMILSFLQWYLVGAFLAWMIAWMSKIFTRHHQC